MCNKCEHRAVCWKCRATGGHVNSCKDFKKEEVRCKDCEHYEKETSSCANILYNSGYQVSKWSDEDYCSHGERKDADG